jgi:acetyl-CoA carboxylase biotin carboxylase subunit
VDTAVEGGTVISPYYDSLIAKLIVWADDRPAAIARGRRALSELEVTGLPTTKGLALDILGSEPFVAGRYSTGYIDEAEALLPALAAE